MSQLRWVVDLSDWGVEATFITALALAVVYMTFFTWRETMTGRSITVLSLSIAGALLHSVLVIWGVISVRFTAHDGAALNGFWDEFFTWLSVICLMGAALALATLTFTALRYLPAEAQTKNNLLCKVLRLGGSNTPENNAD